MHQFIKGGDSSTEQMYKDAAWTDAVILSVDGEVLPVQEVYFRGAGKIAVTFEREVKVLHSDPNVQLISNKEIVQHYQRSVFSGDYHVAKNQYRCERRGVEWKIVSLIVLSLHHGTNEAAKRRYQNFLETGSY
ncbi:MAG: hypothetical protein AAGI28_17190 [Pseudomonadota bacterium]